MKVRLGFVSNSSSSSFVITEKKLNDVIKATENNMDYTEVKDQDREALLNGIITRAQEDIDGGWDVDENNKKISRAKELLSHPEVKIYLTNLICDGYWTTDLFFEDENLIEYATSAAYYDLIPYTNYNINIYPEDCLSRKFDLSELNAKHKKIIIEVFNSFTGDEIKSTAKKLDFTGLSQSSRKLLCDLFTEYKNMEAEE